jgi:cobalt/nickel transport system ATP-binding protein
VVFTPSADLAPEIADRVVLVGDGSIVADGPAREVLTDTALLSTHGLRPPTTVRLFEGLCDPADVPLTVPAARQWLLDDRE